MPRRRRKSVVCANCQYRFDGIDNYCPNCGQENHSHHAPIKHLLLELIEGLTHFDTKFASSTKALFLHPGKLTKDYIQDKRARYVPPMRMYIFISFIFFFCLSLVSSSGGDERPLGLRTIDTTRGVSFRIGSEGISLGDPKEALEYANLFEGNSRVTNTQIDSAIVSKEPNIGWFRKVLLRQHIKGQFGLITAEQVFHTYFKNAGISLFFFMPLFAFFLKILTRKKHRRLYIEHLIFSLHFHSFILVILAFALLVSTIMEDAFWAFIILLWIPLYGVFAMKKVYERPWASTIIKSILLTAIYGGVVLSGLIVAMFISALVI